MSRANAGTKGVPRADRELQILRAACEVFGTMGFAKASVAGIAADAGISKPLVYQYFGSKEGLFLASFNYGAETLAAEMERVAADDTVSSVRSSRSRGCGGCSSTRQRPTTARWPRPAPSTPTGSPVSLSRVSAS
ncbi:TetR/AcrR family transcriptional regulator [Nocardioides albus]|uniref:AcrR family transcriptional regulator n=1 Tax=Nocardioides albus TaxID=1841 RepID=A0A7W5F7I0_9ACTN|nr:TetR/AcrR family transcriptional regulator [Nocardioides albus]MBB3088046.1 AcrR family transcriptional regulator [Nocardioides albus]